MNMNMDGPNNRPPAPAATLGQTWNGSTSASSLEKQGEQTTHNLPLIAVILGIIITVSILGALAGWAWRAHQRSKRFAEGNSSTRRGSAKSEDKAEKGEVEVESDTGHPHAAVELKRMDAPVEPVTAPTAVGTTPDAPKVNAAAADVKPALEITQPTVIPEVVVTSVDPTSEAGQAQDDGKDKEDKGDNEDKRQSGGRDV